MHRLFVECIQTQQARERNQNSPQNVRPRMRLAPAVEPIQQVIQTIASLTLSVLVGFGQFLRVPIPISAILHCRARMILVSITGVLAFVLVATAAILWMIQPNPEETLDQIWAELTEMRSDHVDPDQWDEFRNRTMETLKRLTPKLESIADRNDRASMSCLWVARDFLPLALEKGPALDADLESRIESHLSRAKSEPENRGQTSEPIDAWMVLIVILDACGLAFAVWRFGVLRG